MASWLSFEGKTVDAALKNAGKELGIPVDKLQYEVDFAGSSGIFGLVGAKNAKIRVVAPSSGKGSAADVLESQRQEILSLVDETFAESDAGQPAPARPAVPVRPASPSRPAAPARQPVVPVTAEEPEEEEDEDDDDEADAAEELDEEEEAVPDRVYTEADFECGKNALAKIIGCIVPEATITLEIKNSHVLFNVEGEKAAMLIGKHGQTLKAMQHVVEKIVHKSCGERVRVMVDVEQYLEKRRASLKSLATKMAEKVKQTGKPSTINRMDAFERKIIHDALRKNKHVKTRSAGGGEIRNVVIHPGKKTWRPKKAQAK